MDEDSENISGELLRANVIDRMSGFHSELPPACVLCHRILSAHNDAGDLGAISICGDCKFLFVEDSGTPTEEANRRRTARVRRTRESSSESIENFSQQFSHMISLVRQNQLPVPDNENQTAETDAAARFLQRMHPRTTPSGSRRWRRVLSDTESDGFDSVYGESESNVSFGRYRPSQNESDAISFSAYGGDSDVSIDGHSFLDTELFVHPVAGSEVDSDTDIDPMGAGLNQWNSDDQEEEEEEEEDNEWEEADTEENVAETSAEVHPQNSLGLHSPESERVIRLRIEATTRRRMRRRTYILDIFSNLEEPEVLPFVGNSGDYLDARGFDELLEQLAEVDSSRRGAPPAAVSFVNSLPCLVINEEHEKQDGLACAICKDFLSVGTVVNQLPCFHLYHPSCILPWLRARNSCPLCRYELPTDDKDYDKGKRQTSSSLEISEIQQQVMSEDSSSDSEVDGMEQADLASESFGRESARGRWIFLAAAPIVSLVGIVLVLWFGNPLTERRGPIGRHDLPGRGQRLNPSSDSNRSRRWWSLF